MKKGKEYEVIWNCEAIKVEIGKMQEFGIKKKWPSMSTNLEGTDFRARVEHWDWDELTSY